MTEQTAIDYIKKLFANTTDESISLEEAYRAADRTEYDAKVNRIWLGNKLTALKKYNFVTPLYTMKNNSQFLEKIQLTESGKRVLQRSETSNASVPERELLPTPSVFEKQNENAISLTEVVDMIAELGKRENKSSITFDIKLREGIVSVRIGG